MHFEYHFCCHVTRIYSEKTGKRYQLQLILWYVPYTNVLYSDSCKFLSSLKFCVSFASTAPSSLPTGSDPSRRWRENSQLLHNSMEISEDRGRLRLLLTNLMRESEFKLTDHN